jgi:hypothetical protein
MSRHGTHRRYNLIRDLYADYAVIQSGFWRLEIDLARPRITSLRADPEGIVQYCQEMLEPGFGGESIAETADGVFRSRHSTGHKIETVDGKSLRILGIRLGDFAEVDWTVSLEGEKEDILHMEIARRMLRDVPFVTEIPFGFQCLREFAFWSHPSLRFGHDPTGSYNAGYSSPEEVAKRRVIGYHSAGELPEFFIHGSPSYPDLSMKLSGGWYHLEMRYSRHLTFGVSSRDFSKESRTVPCREGAWVINLRAVRQGDSAPVSFHCGNERLNRFVPAFFDAYLLSGLACDFEYFGNNPYRHAYAPGAVHFMTRGYLVSDRRCWSEQQGDMEARWRRHIRRTLSEGMRSPGRLLILMDSGVWQDACGGATEEYGAPGLQCLFITACCQVILKSGDREFAEEIVDSLKRMMKPVILLDTDDDGLLENPIPGTPGSPASSYNDELGIGHKDGYLNACACEALTLLGSLAEWLGDEDSSARYRGIAGDIAEAYNEQLWDENADRYVGWIDVDGKLHDDWYTYINFQAVVAGIPPEGRVRKLMQSFITHPNHHRIFAAGVNLDPITDESREGGSSMFGVWLNGGILLGPASMELYARAVGLGGSGTRDMIRDLLTQWDKDHLAQTPMIDWCRRTPTADPRLYHTGGNAYTWIDGAGAAGAGTEPYLSDGGAILWALYAGVLGIRADFQGIRFIPHLPEELADTRVSIRLMGRRITIQYHGFGDILQVLEIRNKVIPSDRQLHWEEIADGDVIEIVVGMGQ